METLAELFLLVAQRNRQVCLLHKMGGRYVPVSTAELVDRVRRLARALEEAGVGPGDRVALMAENGPHWPSVDFATLCMGAVLVPIYPTLTPAQAAYIAHDCGARLLFAQGRERLEGLLALRGEMPRVERFISIGGEPGGNGETATLETMIAGARDVDVEAFERRARARRPDDLATFIYTSGTTGNPKGVMLTHGNLASNVVAAAQCIPAEEDFVALSFLPLSHSFERTVDYIYFYRGTTIAYAESVTTVPQNLLEARPQVFVAVPRVYEKLLAKVQETASRSSALRQRIFRWATGVGRRALPYRLRRQRPPGLLGLQLRLAERLVFSKIKARLGGRFLYANSGGAPLSRDVAEFFWGAGMEIYEGYGLSETSPVLTVNRPLEVKLGTVGRAIPGVALRIAADGEVLARGPNIMRGYYNLPRETAEVFDDEGWFRTGDVGALDADGYLTITDRKKEILVSAYGKNVAPAPIENALKASLYVSQAVVLGDRRKFLAALLVPDFENLRSFAERQGLDGTDTGRLLDRQEVRRLFAGEVEAVNRDLARYEQIRAWELLPGEFTIESGELTPTQKVKRRVVNQRYADLIEGMYTRAETTTAE